MTAQIRDSILYKGKQYSLATEPLRPYLQAMDISYLGISTGNYRGYVASWEVKNEKLYLTKLVIPEFWQEKDREEDLFPGEDETFAEWYTGKLRIPHGELLEYEHQGYGSIYENELFLRFLNGELLGVGEKDNRKEYEENLARKKRYRQENENKKILNRIRRLFHV